MRDNNLIIDRIKEHFQQEDYPSKTSLVTEGKVARKLYYIEKGLVRAWFTSDGKEVTFQFIFEGQFVSSFESLLNDAPSWYSVETLEPVTAFSISVETFRRKMETFPHIKAFYHNYVQQRLLVYQQLFISRIRESPEERYQQLIKQHPEIIRRVPQHYIASYLGITSVSLSRIRNRR